MFLKKTIRDLPLNGRKILLRADFNVPISGGKIDDDYRIVQSLPSIKYLLQLNCAIVICAHLGRPDGADPKFSLEPIAAYLSKLLNMPVGFMPECIGEIVKGATRRLNPGQILLLENLRFNPGEQANDENFAKQLAADSSASYFVQDGFGVVYEKRASTDAITRFLPSVAGLLLEKEVTTITDVMSSPKRPFIAILGGAKVSDKIKLIERFVQEADKIIIGGEMVTSFMAFKNMPVGKSVHDESLNDEVGRIYKLAESKIGEGKSVDELIIMPRDVVVADSPDEGARTALVDVNAVPENDYIFDIGPESSKAASNILETAGTIVWNGTLGMAEQPAYAHGSSRIAETISGLDRKVSVIIGGGDTADFVRKWSREHGLTFGYISTGGGASLELMAGERLAGVDALLDK